MSWLSKIYHGGKKIVVPAVVGLATGGPVGAAEGAAKGIAKVARGNPKAVQPGVAPDTAAGGYTSQPSANALMAMSNEQVLVLGLAAFALVAAVGKRRR